MRLGSLFSGYGGLDMAVQAVMGGTTAWASDNDPGASKILAHHWPDVPNLGDITKIDWAAVEPVDIITGGSPCQDLSHAGKRGGMTEGTRSNLWVSMREAIATIRPTYVIWENVRGALSAEATSDVESREGLLGTGRPGPYLRAAGRVLGDLAELGYDSRMCGLRAADAGAPHGRFRVFVVAGDADRRDSHRRAPARLQGQARPPIGLAPDADDTGPQGSQPARRRDMPDRSSPPDTEGDPWRIFYGDYDLAPDADEPSCEARIGRPWTGNAGRLQPVVGGGADWGDYEPAIRRWERILGRPAPAPTEPGRTNPRLSPRFVEWLMGLPAGHVTDVPGLTRNGMLKALGNGVVPAQAEAALRYLLAIKAAA